MKPATKERLDELCAEFGSLSADLIIHEARDESSPLHAEYEWDKAVAHEIYLRTQTQRLIREWYVYQTVGKDETVRVRRLVSIDVSDEGIKGRKYYPIETVLADREMTNDMLEDALRELAALKRKYHNLSALAPVFSAIDDVVEQKETRRKGKPKGEARSVA